MIHELNLLDIVAYLYIPNTTMVLTMKNLVDIKNYIEQTYASVEVDIDDDSLQAMQFAYEGVDVNRKTVTVKLSNEDFEKICRLKCPYMEDRIQKSMSLFDDEIKYIRKGELRYEIVLGADVLKYKDKPSFEEHSYLLHKEDRYTDGGYAVEVEWKRCVDKELNKIYLKQGDEIWLWSLWNGFERVTIDEVNRPSILGDFMLTLKKEDGDVISVGAPYIENDIAWNDGGFIFSMDKHSIIPLARKYTKSKMKPYEEILKYLSNEEL